jgi:hypothetical protein
MRIKVADEIRRFGYEVLSSAPDLGALHMTDGYRGRISAVVRYRSAGDRIDFAAWMRKETSDGALPKLPVIYAVPDAATQSLAVKYVQEGAKALVLLPPMNEGSANWGERLCRELVKYARPSQGCDSELSSELRQMLDSVRKAEPREKPAQ